MMNQTAQITRLGDEIYVKCPYNESIYVDLRAMNGRWDAAAKVWILPAYCEYTTHKIIRKHYQVDGPMPQRANRISLQALYK